MTPFLGPNLNSGQELKEKKGLKQLEVFSILYKDGQEIVAFLTWNRWEMSQSLRFTKVTQQIKDTTLKTLGVLISSWSISCAVLLSADAPETENQNHNRAAFGYNSSWIRGTMSVHGREMLGRLSSLSITLDKEAWICSDKAGTATKHIIVVLSLNWNQFWQHRHSNISTLKNAFSISVMHRLFTLLKNWPFILM